MLAVAVVALVAGALTGAGDEAPVASVAPFDGRSPRAPVGERMRVLVELDRPALGERIATEPLTPAQERANVRSLRRETTALQSALRAKGVQLGDPVIFTRVWAGFAATIDPVDFPQLQTLGLRAEPVRRFYPATVTGTARGALAQAAPDEPPVQGPPQEAPEEPAADPREAPERPRADVALLDSGVDPRAPGLRGRVALGFDAVRGRTPRRGAGAIPGEHGTALAEVLAAKMPRTERMLAVRVAARRADPATGAKEELATTDQLLAGLERAVDPDGDGDAADGVPVALVGVSSPYAGFARAPEAEAAAAASELGTLVVAPAGNDGRGAGRFGTVGSPGAAPEALAVGALEGGSGPALPSVRLGLAGRDGRATLDGVLLGGRSRRLRAPTTGLSGPSQADARARAKQAPASRAAGGRLLEYFAVDAKPKARGKVVVVPARAAGRPEPSAAARASAAASAGAAALVVCEPGDDSPLRAVPRGAAGDVPVIGLRGDDARRALELTRDPDALAFLSEASVSAADAGRGLAASSSRGPTYALTTKPDLVAPGAARTLRPDGKEDPVAGTSVAAAVVAARAAALHERRPELEGTDLAAALVATAAPRGPLDAAGAGLPGRADATTVLADPWILSLPPQPAARRWRAEARVRLRNPGGRAAEVRLAARAGIRGVEVAVTPGRVRLAPRASATATLRVATAERLRARVVEGRIVARGPGPPSTIPFSIPVGEPPRPRLGALALTREGGRMTGVRFPAGGVARAGDRLSAEPIGTLVLRLVDARSGDTVRELTPADGAPDLLPGVYAYELTQESLGELKGRRLRFVATARGTVGRTRAVRRSPEFTAR